MKYADMQRAKGDAAKAGEPLTPEAVQAVHERERPHKATGTAPFRMWRGEDGRYYASLRCPCGATHCVEAEVVEAEALPGKPPRKGFEGEVYSTLASMLRGAKLKGDKRAIPEDLLATLEEVPFDDSAALSNIGDSNNFQTSEIQT